MIPIMSITNGLDWKIEYRNIKKEEKKTPNNQPTTIYIQFMIYTNGSHFSWVYLIVLINSVKDEKGRYLNPCGYTS